MANHTLTNHQLQIPHVVCEECGSALRQVIPFWQHQGSSSGLNDVEHAEPPYAESAGWKMVWRDRVRNPKPCALCAYLVEYFKVWDRSVRDQPWLGLFSRFRMGSLIEIEATFDDRSNGVVDRMKMLLDVNDVLDTGLGIKLIANPPAEAQQYDAGPYTAEASRKDGHPFIDHLMAQAKIRLHECLGTHRDCQEYEAQWLPTRLLNIYNTAATVQVITTEQLSSRLNYVALSHCWGTADDKLLLTQSNVAELREGIAVDRLAKTFKDAIWVTHQLGYKLLWIDSLCIIQDSEEDWQKESADMGYVYGNATFVIASLSAAGDEQGFLDLNKSYSSPVLNIAMDPTLDTDRDRTPYASRSLSQYDSKQYESLRVFWAPDVSLFQKRALELPILDRAWVFQEVMFAKRTMAFAWGQMFWYCNSFYAPVYYHHDGMHRLYTTGLPSRRPHTLSDLVQIWCQIIVLYSAMHLTRSTDRLIALAGISREIHMNIVVPLGFSTQYAAGLWQLTQNAFVRQLLWSSVCPQELQPPKPPLLYIAPSWSWACVNAAVHFAAELTRRTLYTNATNECSLLRIKSVRIVLENSASPFGQVESGRLKIHGRLIKVSDLGPHEVTGANEFEFRDLRMKWMPDTMEAAHLDSSGLLEDLLLLPTHVFQSWADHGRNKDRLTLCLLALTPATPGGVYRRIDLAQASLNPYEELVDGKNFRFLVDLGFNIVEDEWKYPSELGFGLIRGDIIELIII